MIRTLSALVSLGLIGFSGATLASTTTTTKAPVVAIGSGTIVAQNLGNEGVSEGGAGSGEGVSEGGASAAGGEREGMGGAVGGVKGGTVGAGGWVRGTMDSGGGTV